MVLIRVFIKQVSMCVCGCVRGVNELGVAQQQAWPLPNGRLFPSIFLSQWEPAIIPLPFSFSLVNEVSESFDAFIMICRPVVCLALWWCFLGYGSANPSLLPPYYSHYMIGGRLLSPHPLAPTSFTWAHTHTCQHKERCRDIGDSDKQNNPWEKNFDQKNGSKNWIKKNQKIRNSFDFFSVFYIFFGYFFLKLFGSNFLMDFFSTFFFESRMFLHLSLCWHVYVAAHLHLWSSISPRHGHWLVMRPSWWWWAERGR